MKAKIIRALSLALALILCVCSFTPAFAEASTDPINELVNAEILYVPLKNRIVFSFGAPALPDGIVLRLTYADGSTQKAVVTKTDDGCFANGERLSGGFNPAVVSYGILTGTLFVGDAQVKIEYKYLAVPPILTIIKGWIASLS